MKFTRPEILDMLAEAHGYLKAADQKRAKAWQQAIDRLLDELNRLR